MERYDSYKDSSVKWLGEIPSHWEIMPGLAILKENKTKNTDLLEKTVLSLSYGKIVIKKDIDEGLVPADYKVYQIVHPGYIIIRCTDLQNDKVSLRTGLVKDEGIITGAYLGLIVDENYNSSYIHYFFHSWDITKEIYRHGSGLRQSLSWLDLRRLPILLPTREEQNEIVSYLDSATSKIDEAIAQQQKMIDLLNERKQIIINNAVTKGLDPNVKMKPSGIDWIGDIPEHWEIKKLKYFSNVKGRVGFKGYSASDLVEEGAYSLGGKHITNNVVDLTEPTYLSWKKYYESPEIMIKKGDIVTAQRGSLGHTAIIEEDIGPATINPSLVLITNIKCYNKYLYWYLLSYPILKTIEVLNTATAVPMLSQRQIENMTIAMPSYKEQELISAYLEKETKKIEVSKEIVKNQISLLQERKQIIINDVVTGKVKVV